MNPKTPLRYPNDNPKAINIFLPHLPPHVREVVSLFLTGGSLELGIANNNINVRAITHNIELFKFWVCIACDAPRVALIANEFYTLLNDEDMFNHMQEIRNNQDDPFIAAAIFYALNRSSDGGYISSGRYVKNHPLFNDRSLENLAKFRSHNFIVSHADCYIDACNHFSDKFMICCPFSEYSSRSHSANPVPLEAARIDHVRLRETLVNRKNWLLLYKLNDDVLDAYDGYEYKLYDQYCRETKDYDKAREILIFANNL